MYRHGGRKGHDLQLSTSINCLLPTVGRGSVRLLRSAWQIHICALLFVTIIRSAILADPTLHIPRRKLAKALPEDPPNRLRNLGR
jgi:hypothetical protein